MKISRRATLRGLAGAAVGLPWLEATQAARAQEAPPQRLVVFFSPNGFYMEKRLFAATKQGSTPLPTVFPEGLKPLEKWRDHLIAVQGLLNKAGMVRGGNHVNGFASILTNTDHFRDTDWAAGPSIEEFVISKLAPKTKLSVLHTGVFSFGWPGGELDPANAGNRLCYTAAGQSVPNFDRPSDTFAAVFGAPGQGAELEALRRRRRSVLDVVKGRYQSTFSRLGRADQMKIDAHLSAINEVERRLDFQGTVCEKKPVLAIEDPFDEASMPDVSKAQLDLVVRALACDVTRAATVQYSSAQGGPTLHWAGAKQSHHGVTHASDSEAELLGIDKWYASQFAYLLEGLASVKEGNGTLLDNTIVLWVNELSAGWAHTLHNGSVLIAGGGRGALRPGRLLHFPSECDFNHLGCEALKTNDVYHGDLLVSVMNAMGVPGRTFGDPAFCRGPLPGLLMA